MKKTLIYIFIPLIVLLLDLSSKYYINNIISENESVTIINNFIYVTLVYNHGTTFGLFQDYSPYLYILVVKSIVVIVLLLVLLKIPVIIKDLRYQKIGKISILIIIGGSTGNIIDRLMDKKVTDFIDIGINGYRWHIFNLADAFQVIGGIIIFVILISEYIRSKRYIFDKDV